MHFREYRSLVKQDKSRFVADNTGKRVSVHITSVFRLGNYLLSQRNVLARLLLFIVAAYYFILRLVTGIQLPLGTKVRGG